MTIAHLDKYLYDEDEVRWGGPVAEHLPGQHDQMAHAGKGRSMHVGEERFRQAGGVTPRIGPDKAALALSLHDRTQQALERRRPFGPHTGDEYTGRAVKAASNPDSIVYIAQAPGGAVAGAISYRVKPDGDLLCDYLGSTEVMPGAGSALTAKMMRDAARRGVGVTLMADSGAVPFWRKMGFEKTEFSRIPGSSFLSMSADEVKAVVAG